MRAAVSARYGSPEIIEILQVPKPAPKADEVRVRVHAATVNRTDDGMLRPHPFFARLFTGLLRPKYSILGMEFAGIVEAVGADVASFQPGERVFGMSPVSYGAHADYLCVSESDAIAQMPANIAFDEAVVCEGAWYANNNLKKVNVQSDDNILIYGASGAIGTAAVQLAKAYGATVTAVVATKHLALAETLGADRVIDYTAQDFTQIDDAFDFVFDSVGKTTYFRCRRLLKPSGVFAATDLGPWAQNIWLTLWSSITRSRRVIFATPTGSRAFVHFLKERIEAGKFHGVIDRVYPLEEIADAYRYVETEQKTGIVVIDVAPADGDDGA
jgi:NADPH:quinone reductase-like Zn-dependent oxidoreductase